MRLSILERMVSTAPVVRATGQCVLNVLILP
jgi:hypothetical protein